MMDAILRSWLTALPDRSESFNAVARTIDSDTWSLVLDTAARHGVDGLIAPHIDASLVPSAVWDRWQRHEAIRQAWMEELIRAFERLVLLLDREGIKTCALKGPVLSARLYGDPAARSSNDVDLLVDPTDLHAAVAVLEREGFSAGSDAKKAYLLHHGHHLLMTRTGTAAVELHFQAYVGFGTVLPASALLARAVSHELRPGVSVRVPSPEDELLYLALHAAGHSFVKLLWLYDLKTLLAKHPGIDWEQLFARARQAGVVTAMTYALMLTKAWLAISLPDQVEKQARSDMRMAVANAMLPAASTLSERSPVANLKGLVFTSMLCDRWASTGWLLQHHALHAARRRVHRALPDLAPASWAG